MSDRLHKTAQAPLCTTCTSPLAKCLETHAQNLHVHHSLSPTGIEVASVCPEATTQHPTLARQGVAAGLRFKSRPMTAWGSRSVGRDTRHPSELME